MPMAVKPRGTYADYKSGGDVANKIFVFELIKGNNQSNLMRSKETGKPVDFPLTKTIPMVGTINFKDEKTGRTYPRKIRYVPGENSIFVDEQTPDDKFPKTKVLASFIKGRFQVEGSDTPRLDFMMNWDINETNEGRNKQKFAQFRLVDTSKIASQARVADKAKFDLIKWCYDADFATKIQPLASLFFTAEQMTQNTDEIRFNLKIMAERNPVWFKNMLDDKNTERKLVVKAAINRGFLEINAQQNALLWTDNSDAPLSVAAPGKDVLEDFVTKSFSADGERYYKAIYDLMNPPKKMEAPLLQATTSQTAEPVKLDAPLVKAADESDAELLALVKRGVEMNLITVNSTKVWWKYKGESAMKEEGMVTKLRSNPTMLAILKSEVLG